ncbi:hypothetical protein DFH08DRAFT_944474 [Mycena albidolilacea]|uniref:Uncharacterized protein n=1 Tax=Mycena albidolilacea TaxID=1033008 RepID=A0AAD7EAQ0_9AGAR|nr:hypothetical protein DFH08DRAFT_944474 [Mycena albidolilacea]
MPRRASSPGPGPSSLSRASSPPTTPNSEPISLGDADDTLSRSWHSCIHRSPPRSTTPSKFDVELERTRIKVMKALGSIIQASPSYRSGDIVCCSYSSCRASCQDLGQHLEIHECRAGA